MREGNGDKDSNSKLYTACQLMWKKPARYRPKPQRCATSEVVFRMSCIILPSEMLQYQNSSYIHFMVSNG